MNKEPATSRQLDALQWMAQLGYITKTVRRGRDFYVTAAGKLGGTVEVVIDPYGNIRKANNDGRGL